MEYLIGRYAVVFIIPQLLSFVSADDCVTISTCQCLFTNGSLIDLGQVANWDLMGNPTPRFLQLGAKKKGDRNKYSYNPCYKFIYGSSGGCSSGVAACQSSESTYYDIGKQETAHFYFNKTGGNWYISYHDDMQNRVTNVTLECCPGCKNHTLTVIGETVPELSKQYLMTLKSKCACAGGCDAPVLPMGMSSGAVFVITFVVLVLTYLLLGIAYRKVVGGARGIEMIPHASFWMDFPLLVQDGFFFLFGCGRVGTTYERI
ncbi:cation-dependent mannose-6-phosphate receptor-like [Oratosquilla oratoria]|uniref:cation-dependent mannose-6-phosphate receptor-like n=1 Tax=Oratosquilla oratoria TaxID=337810 RepID=UPI003F775BE1